MVKYPNKILYIGAGIHIEPVSHFKHTSDFVFIDTQPRSEFDSYNPKFLDMFYRPKFFSRLVDNCIQQGFSLESTCSIDNSYYKKIMDVKNRLYYLVKGLPHFINPTLLVFINHKTNQTIHYYISTNITHNMCPMLRLDIETCDALIVSGYNPELKVLTYLKEPISFFGYTKTHYIIENDDLQQKQEEKQDYKELDNIIYYLQTNKNQTHFKKFYAILKSTGAILNCDNFDDFKSTIQLYRNQ